ncbi:hypothetical protein GPJ56_005169 [Histomonas meleagridis]|uniref:uncharacterized protein n=1 Tax=Histomonas meleagridis TaxID=135588 RepID=UPI0035598423|nr:hypothetical protein GPJ56_005169 [Histomonas meleagridis]KAH0802685.1 hypothetical protein GO595_004734 [Histomonas meleagridis]
MGCFTSCCGPNHPNIDSNFPSLALYENTSSSSDSSLKAYGKKNARDISPLIEGPTSLTFQDLKLGSSSSDTDLDMDQIRNLLEAASSSDESSSQEQTEDEQVFKPVETNNEASQEESTNT